MNASKTAVCALALALLGPAARIMAQAEPPPPKPGPEHAVLQKDVGTWDASVEIYAPGKPPAVSKGTETNSMLGGLWLVTDFKSEMMGQPFQGHGTTGYDPNKKKYVNTWIDSMSTGLTVGEASYDPASKTLTGLMEGPDMTGKTVKMKQTTEWKDADTRIFTMFSPGPEGKEVPIMKITYKRRK